MNPTTERLGSMSAVAFHTTVTRRYDFAAGHFLPMVPDTHKCKRQHGHNYVVDVTISLHQGAVDAKGFVMDFFALDGIVKPIIGVLDHYNLNDIEGLENPTAENIAKWLAKQITGSLPLSVDLDRLVVFEEKDCWATVTVA